MNRSVLDERRKRKLAVSETAPLTRPEVERLLDVVLHEKLDPPPATLSSVAGNVVRGLALSAIGILLVALLARMVWP